MLLLVSDNLMLLRLQTLACIVLSCWLALLDEGAQLLAGIAG